MIDYFCETILKLAVGPLKLLQRAYDPRSIAIGTITVITCCRCMCVQLTTATDHKIIKPFFPNGYTQITGHTVHIDMLNKVGLAHCRDKLQDLIKKLRDLNFDHNEFMCLKFLILLNPGEMSIWPQHDYIQLRRWIVYALMKSKKHKGKTMYKQLLEQSSLW